MLKVLKVLLMIVACGAIDTAFDEAVEDLVPVEHEIYENTAEGVIYDHMVESKIGGGTPANKTLKLDFVLLSVVFINQAQMCGGTLVTDQWILTSATCVKDPFEGEAAYVYAAVGGAKKPTLTHDKIVIHPDYVEALPPTYANNIAMVKLSKPVKVDGKKVALATLDLVATPDIYDTKTLVYCGWGSIANKPTPPKGLLCTTLLGAKIADCGANANVICTKWPGKENNVCPGDFGGPLYSISGTTQTVVGISSYGPDLRPGTPCLDGHKTEHSQVGGFATFIAETKLL